MKKEKNRNKKTVLTQKIKKFLVFNLSSDKVTNTCLIVITIS